MRGRAVLLRRMPNSSLEERPQEGVQAHGTERMKNLQHLSVVHEEGPHLTKEKHLNKKNSSYSLAADTSRVFALKDSVNGTGTTSASTGTPGVSAY